MGKFRYLCAVMALAFSGLMIWSAHAVFVHDRVALYAENGVLENIQVILLIIACLTFVTPVLFARRADRLLLLFCSLLCYSFALREIDAEKLAIPDFLVLIWSGPGRNATLAAAFAVLLFCAARRFDHYAKMALVFLQAKPGILLVAGGVCLVLGELFEKYVGLPHHAYLEEIFELLGYVFILLSAIAVCKGPLPEP